MLTNSTFPLQSYRVGPYAADGTGFFGGMIDYMNIAQHAATAAWVASSSPGASARRQYAVERGVECYERMKDRRDKPGPAAWNAALASASPTP